MHIFRAVRSSLGLLSKRDKRLYLLAVIAQMALSLLDLAGVILLGLVGVAAAAAGTGQPLPAVVTDAVQRITGEEDVDSASLALWLGLTAGVLLMAKSILAILFQRKLMIFLGNRTTVVASELGRRYFGQSLLYVHKRPSAWMGFALNEGVAGAIAGVLGSASVVFSEVTLLALLGIALFSVDPITTLGAVFYFGLVAMVMSRWLAHKGAIEGEKQADANIMSRTIIQDLMATYREVSVLDRRDFFIERFKTERSKFAMASSQMLFIALIPRYAMEAAMVLGTGLLTASILLTQGADASVGALFLFLAASMRVIPSLLRLSAGHIQLRVNYAFTDRAFELADELMGTTEAYSSGVETSSESHASHPLESNQAFNIELSSIDLQYPDRSTLALQQINLSIAQGNSVALVGPSGSGKSSLADVILGLVPPTEGRVTIGGLEPQDCIARFPGTIAYVPQDVALVFGTVRENVALGIPDDQIDTDRVWEVLALAHLADFIREQPETLLTTVGERGVRLSGGQRQRLGIARALYSSPGILVLDEATSALDAEIEQAVGETLKSLGSDITTVTIAHRLATIRDADRVVYLAEGRIRAMGTFAEVRDAVPDFETQAKLLGL